jgi:branched-chain amino acid transport system ATP-binding protein
VPISAGEPLLQVEGLEAGYGKIAVLHGVSLRIAAGEVVALLGPNGAGKTTLLRAMSGLLPVAAGTIRFAGRDMRGTGPREAARAGLVHVIEGHRVFTQISVADNLLLAGYDLPRSERAQRIEEALEYFPEIAAKRQDRGGALSGGQQQMLVVAQGLVRRPRLIMLDEPSAGLSPVLVDRVLGVVSALLVEQLIEKALAVSDRVYAMVQGDIALEAQADEPHLPHRLERTYFGGESPMHVHA